MAKPIVPTKATPPAPGAPIVRPQIKEMMAPGKDEDFEKTLPQSTAAVAGEVIEPLKRKRRTQAEMAAARGQTPADQSEVDPLMADPRFRRIVGEMSGMGGKELVAVGFNMSGAPLNDDEEKRVDDVFYVMARKGGFNPANSWFALVLYFVAVIGQLIISRTDLGEKVKELLKKPEPKKLAPKPEATEKKEPIA